MNDNSTAGTWKDFVFICCPWCDLKTKDKDEFTRHCLEKHQDSVIEECDSIELFVSKALQGKNIPKTKMQIRKEWEWAMSDDLKTSETAEESSQLRDEESKVHTVFIL